MENLLQIAMQMILCLVIAAVIGAIIGYLIGKLATCNERDKEAVVTETQQTTLTPEGKEKDIPEHATSDKEPQQPTEHKPQKPVEAAFAIPAAHTANHTPQNDTSTQTPPAQAIQKNPDAIPGERPAMLSAPEAGIPDDLKEISGIGLKIEDALNELGIFHFEQIAQWTEKNIEWIENFLSFKGRVNRENWVGQAKILAAGKQHNLSNKPDSSSDTRKKY